MTTSDFARRLRERIELIGYWVVLDSPFSTERLAGLGYDYVAIDAQHGLIGPDGVLRAVQAVDAARGVTGTPSVALVRTESTAAAPIGRAVDAGANGVIVPLVDDAATAAAAVRAARYPPHGIRSYGQVRVVRTPAESDDHVVVLAMIETAAGLAAVEQICAVPGLDGVYVGPSDLSLGLGAAVPGDPAVAEVFEAALARITTAAEQAGVAAGIHTPDGVTARRRLDQGFTFATVSADVSHLEQAARDHLAVARGR